MVPVTLQTKVPVHTFAPLFFELLSKNPFHPLLERGGATPHLEIVSAQDPSHQYAQDLSAESAEDGSYPLFRVENEHPGSEVATEALFYLTLETLYDHAWRIAHDCGDIEPTVDLTGDFVVLHFDEIKDRPDHLRALLFDTAAELTKPDSLLELLLLESGIIKA